MRLFSAVAVATTLAVAFAAESLRGSAAPTTDFAAWAGEEDKAAWAGIDDPLRVSVNAVRIAKGLPAMAAEPSLKTAALQLARDLATADSPQLVEEAGNKKVLDRAKEFGFNGTAVKTTLFSEDVRNRTDVDGAVTAFLKSVTASKDAFAGLEDPDHKYVGAGAWFSATNRVYYAQLYGK